MSKHHNKNKDNYKPLSLQQITTRSNKKKMDTRADTAAHKVFDKFILVRISFKQIRFNV